MYSLKAGRLLCIVRHVRQMARTLSNRSKCTLSRETQHPFYCYLPASVEHHMIYYHNGVPAQALHGSAHRCKTGDSDTPSDPELKALLEEITQDFEVSIEEETVLNNEKPSESLQESDSASMNEDQHKLNLSDSDTSDSDSDTSDSDSDSSSSDSDTFGEKEESVAERIEQMVGDINRELLRYDYKVQERNDDGVQERNDDEVQERSDDEVQERSDDEVQEWSNDEVQEQSDDEVQERSNDGVQERSNDEVQERSDDEVQERSNDGVQERSDDEVQERSDDEVLERSDDDVPEWHSDMVQEQSDDEVQEWNDDEVQERSSDSVGEIDVDKELLRYDYEEFDEVDGEKNEEYAEEEEEVHPIPLTRGERGVFDVEELVEVLRTDNMADICAIALPEEVRLSEHMVIVTGRSARHLHSTAAYLQRLYKLKRGRSDPASCPVEGQRMSDWLAMDLGNIILHLFETEVRAEYDLESLWTVGREYDPLSQAKYDTVDYSWVDEYAADFKQFQTVEKEDNSDRGPPQHRRGHNKRRDRE